VGLVTPPIQLSTQVSWDSAPTTTSSTPSDSTLSVPIVGEDSALDRLLSENARLILENKLLRDGWAADNAVETEADIAVLPCQLAKPGTPPAAEQQMMYMVQPMWWVCPGPSGYCDPQADQSALPGQDYPCTQQFEAIDEGAPEEVPVNKRTTLMLRNLPNNYSRAMVLATLDDEGFAGLYDFIYLPIDFKSRACLGYAFVNLVSPEVVPAFWSKFDGHSNWMLPSRKVCSVSWSGPYQGLQAHIARYRNSPVMHSSVPEEYKPVILQGGVQLTFPPPTKSPRAPRMRRGTRVFAA